MTVAVQSDTDLVLAIRWAIVGGGGSGEGGGGLACSVSWGSWDVDPIFQDPDVSANRAAIFRQSVARVGLTDRSAWGMTQSCVPFQHVATRIPTVVTDAGLVVPGTSGNLFRFPANLDLRPEDMVFWRVGGRAKTVWVVTDEPSLHVPLARILIAGVERQIEVEAALEPMLPS